MGVDRSNPNAPVFRLLDEPRIRRIHEGALHVLATVGMDVIHEGAREMLVRAGCAQTAEARVTIPGEVVAAALETAPSRFTLYDRNGEPAIELGAGRTYHGAGVTNLAYLDLDEPHPHDFTLEDIGKVAFLADALPNIDFVATPGVLKPSVDLRIEIADQSAFLQMVTNTTMPLVVLSPEAYQLADVLEMAEAVAGSAEALAARPFVMPYLNTVSPLVMNPETVDKLFLAVDRGIPVAVQAAPPIGGSAPVTVAGTLVVAAAETLTGLVLAQLRRPGTPFVSGVVPFVMDMRSGNTATTSPDIMHAIIAMGELTRWWGLPSISTGSGSDSKIPDEQATFDVLYHTQAVSLGGVDMSFSCGRLECGLLHSPLLLVYANEAVDIHRHFFRGLEVSDETLGLDVIAEVGPGGFFLGHEHTREHFRGLWEPTVASWEPRDVWEGRGATSMKQRAAAIVERLRAEHAVSPLREEVLASLHEVIARRGSLLVDGD
jgi:trimethylamine--corrinoid protein Co-methyltransferase